MPKKIEDLTKEEIDNICKKYLEKDCEGCPFITNYKEKTLVEVYNTIKQNIDKTNKIFGEEK